MGRARHQRRRWDFEVGVVKGIWKFEMRPYFAPNPLRGGASKAFKAGRMSGQRRPGTEIGPYLSG